MTLLLIAFFSNFFFAFSGIQTSDPNAVVIGLAPEHFHYQILNQAFRWVFSYLFFMWSYTHFFSSFFSLNNFIHIFIYFWLCWVFIAVWAFSSCGEQGLPSGSAERASHCGASLVEHMLCGMWTSVVGAPGLWCTGLVALRHVGSSPSQIEPVSPALEDKFFTTEPPGKTPFFSSLCHVRLYMFYFRPPRLYMRTNILKITSRSMLNNIYYCLSFFFFLIINMLKHSDQCGFSGL